MSANRLRMICSEMFSKNFHFREKVAHFRILVFDPIRIIRGVIHE